MLREVARELKEHAPYTAAGAATGVVVMLVIVLARAPKAVSEGLFYTLHPLHVVLSAFATTSMYRLRGGQRHSTGIDRIHRMGRVDPVHPVHPCWAAIVIGYTGAIGVATVSDALIPFLGGGLLGVEMHFHVPFVDPDTMHVLRLPTWLVVNSCALAGVALAFWKPTTRLPHVGHTLLSTWASLFGFTAFGDADWLRMAPLVFVFLFLAVWLPCCVSDIVYPLLWTARARSGPDAQA